MCKVYTGYCGTREIEHGLCACTVDNPLAKARGLSLRTGAQPMLYLPLVCKYIRKKKRLPCPYKVEKHPDVLLENYLADFADILQKAYGATPYIKSLILSD